MKCDGSRTGFFVTADTAAETRRERIAEIELLPARTLRRSLKEQDFYAYGSKVVGTGVIEKVDVVA